MKKIKYILLAIGIGTLSFFIVRAYLSTSKSTIESNFSEFRISDTGAITKVFIADMKNNQVLLERTSGQSWTLNGQYPAFQHNINKMLETVNLMTVKSPVAKARYDKTIRDMSSVGIKVELYTNATTPAKVIYIGTSNQSHTGNYMMIEGSNLPYLVHIEGFNGFLSPRFSPFENDWRTKNIFTYDPKEIAEIKLTFPKEPTKGFSILQSAEGKISVLNNMQMPVNKWDTNYVLDYIERFRNVNFESWEETKTPLFIDSILQSTPLVIYEVTNKAGNKTKVETFLKPLASGIDMDGNPIDHDQDRMYARINGKEFVVIQYFVFDPLNHEIKYFFGN